MHGRQESLTCAMASKAGSTQRQILEKTRYKLIDILQFTTYIQSFRRGMEGYWLPKISAHALKLSRGGICDFVGPRSDRYLVCLQSVYEDPRKY